MGMHCRAFPQQFGGLRAGDERPLRQIETARPTAQFEVFEK
jgi:hypothetical protein